MGNCLKHQSSTKYATDDEGDSWDFQADEGAFATSKGATTNGKPKTEVKIKISKKQLEELLGKADMRELRVEQVLAELISHSRGYESLHKPWRPALQSIPEVN